MSSDSNHSNLNLIEFSSSSDVNKNQNGPDDVADENSNNEQINTNQEEMRVMTQEEYY